MEVLFATLKARDPGIWYQTYINIQNFNMRPKNENM